MSKSQLDSSFIALGLWFERQKRILPWRDQPTLYRVWVSEIMLQQTQVITVVPYFERFLARFPTVESLAAATEDAVVSAWAGLGYYSRARNLRRGALKIVAEGFPPDRAGWLEIPGVGDYTAGAVLSIALGFPEAILDGNVERVISRMLMIDRSLGDTVFKQKLWSASREWVERAFALRVAPSVFNQALMELGATICTPRKPLCLICPLQSDCLAHREGVEEKYPPRKKPKEWLRVSEEVHCVIDLRGRVLLRKREKGEWRAGLWDFVETKPAALLAAEKIGEIETRHVVTRHKITRLTHIWKLSTLQAAESSLLCWLSPLEIDSVGAGSALKKSLQQIGETFPAALGQS